MTPRSFRILQFFYESKRRGKPYFVHHLQQEKKVRRSNSGAGFNSRIRKLFTYSPHVSWQGENLLLLGHKIFPPRQVAAAFPNSQISHLAMSPGGNPDTSAVPIQPQHNLFQSSATCSYIWFFNTSYIASAQCFFSTALPFSKH